LLDRLKWGFHECSSTQFLGENTITAWKQIFFYLKKKIFS
jgi:hypothetical protein